jgi:hypothetical protein
MHREFLAMSMGNRLYFFLYRDIPIFHSHSQIFF